MIKIIRILIATIAVVAMAICAYSGFVLLNEIMVFWFYVSLIVFAMVVVDP